MPECEIFQVYNYTKGPCDPTQVPDIVMSLRKNGLVQIQAVTSEVKIWACRMLSSLKSYEAPDEVFMEAKIKEVRGSCYLLTVKWYTKDQLSLTR